MGGSSFIRFISNRLYRLDPFLTSLHFFLFFYPRILLESTCVSLVDDNIPHCHQSSVHPHMYIFTHTHTDSQEEAILEALSTIGDVSVAAPSNDANYTACHPSYGQWSAGIGNYLYYFSSGSRFAEAPSTSLNRCCEVVSNCTCTFSIGML